jgi:hypothetical protein
MGINRWHVGISCMTALAAGIVPPSAWADGQVLLGGGAGITVNGTACTLTTIGHDNTGQLVGITAAHCGSSGSQVAAEGSGAVVGSVVAADDALDYAVIKFDPAKVTPTANFDGFVINGIGPDPRLRQPACTHGAASGDGCGHIAVQTLRPGVVGAGMPSWRPGDDGEPVTVDGQLVGATLKGFSMVDGITLAQSTHINFALISAIINDANAKGGVGAGFSPV